MRILHILRGLELTSGVSAFLVENANRQSQMGHDVALFYERFLEYKPNNAVKLFQGKFPGRLKFVPDIVHIHSVWSLFSIVAMMWCLWRHIPFVVSPHGCLMPRVMTKGYVKKWLFLKLFLKPFMTRAKALHATAKAELEVLRNLGFQQRAFVIPLGVDLPIEKPKENTDSKTVLFVGRLSEEKGLLILLRAWALVRMINWRLVIAGPDWKGFKNKLDDEIVKLGLSDNVDFPGLVSGKAKEACYRAADVFVLPSPMENFSSVVLEAMAYSLPVIATNGTPWMILEERGCGWWIDQGVKSLSETLRKAMCLTDNERICIGTRGRKLAEEQYSWNSATKKLILEYGNVLEKGCS